MPLLLTEADTASLLTMDALVPALEAAFLRQSAGHVSNLPRRRIHAPEGTFHFMEAADFGLGRAVIKAYASFRPRTRFVVLLYDTLTGNLLAIIEADRLGQMRTGAATGIATKFLAREDSRTLALFGAGWQAETQAHAVASVRPLTRVNVYSRGQANRETFAARLSAQLGIDVFPVSSPTEALDNADIVVTATTSRSPVFDGASVRPGIHINAVGSNALSKAELDVDTVGRADCVVVDSLDQSKMEAGDLLAPIEGRKLRWEHAVELSDVVGGIRPGRKRPEDITLFKSNGIALEDVVAASLLYDRALDEKVGREIPMWE